MPNKLPKEYREEIYSYVEDLLERPLTFEEHDELRDMILDYVFDMRSIRMYVRRTLCMHAWASDKKVEGGKRPVIHLKCRKCDKRKAKRMPSLTT